MRWAPALALLLLVGCQCSHKVKNGNQHTDIRRASDMSCFKGENIANPKEGAKVAAAKHNFRFFYFDWGGGMSQPTPGVSLGGNPSERQYGKEMKPIGTQPFREADGYDTSAEMTDCEKAMAHWARKYNAALCPLANANGISCKVDTGKAYGY